MRWLWDGTRLVESRVLRPLCQQTNERGEVVVVGAPTIRAQRAMTLAKNITDEIKGQMLGCHSGISGSAKDGYRHSK